MYTHEPALSKKAVLRTTIQGFEDTVTPWGRPHLDVAINTLDCDLLYTRQAAISVWRIGGAGNLGAFGQGLKKYRMHSQHICTFNVRSRISKGRSAFQTNYRHIWANYCTAERVAHTVIGLTYLCYNSGVVRLRNRRKYATICFGESHKRAPTQPSFVQRNNYLTTAESWPKPNRLLGRTYVDRLQPKTLRMAV